MKLSNWSREELRERLQGRGLCLRTGPFLSRIRTRIPAVIEGIGLLYADNTVSDSEPFADFHIAMTRPRALRRWYRPQVNFELDGVVPFKPLPLQQSLPMLEWGLNWCIGFHAHQFLIIHAATVERNGVAAILPGPPGSGKSTLTAYLVHKGWRLLSDELALLSPRDGSVTPLARPISLKNQSIDLIAKTLPGVTLSPPTEDTAKGTVALLKAPVESLDRIDETARPAWIIFPRFEAGTPPSLESRSRADTLIELGRNAFNYSVHGKVGFDVLVRLVEDCTCYSLTYSRLEDAREVFESLQPAPALASAISA